MEAILSLGDEPGQDRDKGNVSLPVISHSQRPAGRLARCMKELGFVDALGHRHINGRFYNDKALRRVPIYLHATLPSKDMVVHFEGDYPPEVTKAMSPPRW